MTTTLTTETSEVTLPQIAGNGGLFVDGDWIESKDQDPNGDVRLIQMMDIADGDYLNKSSRFLTSDKARELRCTYLEAGDVLVSRMPDPLGRACIFPGDPKPCVTAVDVCIIRPDESRADRRWLKYMINSPRFRSQVERWSTGTTRARISRGNLGKIRFELPPLSEQKRIADILDKADAIRRKRQDCSSGFDDLLQSCFYTTFGDPLHNPLKWPVKSLGKVSVLDRGKSRHRPRDAAFLYGGPYPFVQTGDITNSNGFVRQYSQTYSDEGLAQSKLWPAGTLCITIAANIAKTAVLTLDACFPDSVVGLIPGESLTTEYVRHWFVAMEKAIDAAATQVAQKNINLQILRNLQIQLPPLDMQKHFSDCVNAIRRSREQSVVVTHEVDKLFNSLVQRAFKGEL